MRTLVVAVVPLSGSALRSLYLHGYAADDSHEQLRAAGATTFTRMSELAALLAAA
jgi:hypothetical protein